jgi:serine protease Do
MNTELSSSRRKGSAIVLAAALVIGGAIGAVAMSAHSHLAQNGNAHIALVSAPDAARVANSVSFTAGFAPVVKSAVPAVVNISSTRVVKTRGQQMPFLNDPFFQQFFGPGMQQQQQPQEQREHSLGSGVIVTQDGYILTNNHVVEGAKDIDVELSDQRHFTGKVIGTDPRTDVAVVKIDASGLTAMPLGDSKGLQVGDFVLAIGEPFGLRSTVTMGIVSATGRTSLGIEGQNSYEDFIQTDAAINPGNSGGALVDVHGELVGINTAILAGGNSEMGGEGGNEGVGFAIPVDLARNVMTQIVEHGKVTRAQLGVFIGQLTPALAKQFGLSKAEGALVQEVPADSPGAKAGLQRGDVILGMNGQPYPDSQALRLEISEMAPGTVIRLNVVRNDKPLTIDVKLGEMSDNEQASNNDQGETDGASGLLSGVQVENVTPQIARRLNISPDTDGVVVTQVSQDSPAAEGQPTGLQRGDIIVEVNHHAVHNVREYQDQLSHAGKDSVLLLVNQGGQTFYTVIQAQQ